MTNFLQDLDLVKIYEDGYRKCLASIQQARDAGLPAELAIQCVEDAFKRCEKAEAI